MRKKRLTMKSSKRSRNNKKSGVKTQALHRADLESKIKNMFKERFVKLFEERGIQYTNEELEQGATVFYENHMRTRNQTKLIDRKINNIDETIKQARDTVNQILSRYK